MRGRRWSVIITIAIGLAVSAVAQDDVDPSLDVRVNYVYAAQFGFGAYAVGGLDVNVYSLPIPYTVEHIYRDWDLRIRVPIIYGRYRFSTRFTEDGERIAVSAHTNSMAVAPRLQLDVPIIEGLRISPVASWGIGGTFDSGGRVQAGDVRFNLQSDESWFHTYEAGVTSLYQRHYGDFTAGLGGSLIWAGDDFFDENGDMESYGSFRCGVEGRHPLGFAIHERRPDGGLYFVYDRFFPSLQFTRVRRAALEVTDLFEIGVTVGAASPLDLPMVGDRLDDLRVGAAFQTGDGLDAWKLSLGFPF
jgi:hypothetical protein